MKQVTIRTTKKNTDLTQDNQVNYADKTAYFYVSRIWKEEAELIDF